jgi:hypothetical protein
MPVHDRIDIPFRAVTPAGRHCWFGYYDKHPWDATGRYLLAMEAAFIDRMPAADDVAAIGLVDLETGDWRDIAQTRAWNWQQGTMLQWLPTAPGRQVIFNDRINGRYVSVVLDVFTGERRVLPRPIYAIRPNGREAVSVPFDRLAFCRPGYGYEGLPYPKPGEESPTGDGIFAMDLATGDHRLVFSIAEAAALQPRESMAGAFHWFNHLQYSPDGARFLFLHRWGPGGGVRWATRLFTIRPDGTDLRLIADDGMTSHFDWRDPSHILAWARRKDGGDHYWLFDIETACDARSSRARTANATLVGPEVIVAVGHCSYSPDRRWILTDQYPAPKTRERALILYDPAMDRRIDIGRFYAPPALDGPTRVDLHPRWSRDGRQVCIDSVHEGSRRMYVGDVSAIVGR